MVRGVRTQEQVHRHSAHQRFDQFAACAAGHRHILVQLDAHHDPVVVVIVVFDFAHRTHGITVGEHLARDRQSLRIRETDIIRIARLEHVDALEEIDTQEEEYSGRDGSEGNFNLVGDFHEGIVLRLCVVRS